MSNPYDLERQERKNHLKQNMIPDPTPQERKDREAVIREKRALLMRQMLMILVIIVIVIIAARLIVFVRTYSEASVAWERTDVGGSGAIYEMFGDRILKVTDGGVSAMLDDGTVLWNHGYTMRNPRVLLQGKYGAVADIQSKTAVIFSQDGVTGTVETTQPIVDFGVSSVGVLVLELDNTDSDFITFYDNTGKTLDIRIKTKLSGDGYPMALSLSPEGTALMTSMIYLDQGLMQNRIVFYDFDAGKTDSNRIVGYFSYGETMFPEVRYLSDTCAVAFGDNQINIYSLQNARRPLQTKSISFDTTILSVFASENRIGVITSDGEGGRRITLYDTAGHSRGSAKLEFEYSHVEFSGHYVILINGSDCMILNSQGRVKFRGSLGKPIRKIMMQSDDSFLLFTDSAMQKIRLK